MPTSPDNAIDPAVLAVLRCPLTRSPLKLEGDWLIAQEPASAGLRYPVREGIPVLIMDQATLPEGVTSLAEFKTKYASAIRH